MQHVEVESGNFVVASASAYVEIWREPSAVSSQVDGAGSCLKSQRGSEGLYETMREGGIVMLPLNCRALEVRWSHGASVRTRTHAHAMWKALNHQHQKWHEMAQII